MCSNPDLLGSTLRDEWNFTGHVVSDCGAVSNGYEYRQDGIESLENASARAVKAGTDMNCGDAYSTSLSDALLHKLLTADDIDTAITRSLFIRFQLGTFDPKAASTGANPFASISADVVGSNETIALARKAAAESVVLLKNKEDTLPLFSKDASSKYKNIAIVGPAANDSLLLLGNYHGLPATTPSALAADGTMATPLLALQHRLHQTDINVSYAPGMPVIVGDGAWEFGFVSACESLCCILQ